MFSRQSTFFCVDMGTTRTRAWLVKEGAVLTRRSGDFGVRNVASGKPKQWLEQELNTLLKQTHQDARSGGMNDDPTAIFAAGMITSDHGLQTIPHVEAPAGKATLAKHTWSGRFPGDFNLPLVLIPGIRTPGKPGINGILQGDMLRGEETLCFGLLETGRMQRSMDLLNLGSHWKWISIDDEERITSSRTTLAGEMIHAIQAHTLIASALPQEAPQTLDASWLDAGFNEARISGLGRALFGVRLLQQADQGSSKDRLSFLYGAFIQSEIDALLAYRGNSDRLVLVNGHPSLAKNWTRYLNQYGIAATVVTNEERDQAYLSGLLALSTGS